MGLRYIWRIGYDNRATCHEVRALRQGVFSNLLKPPSRLNIQVLTESPTYLPPSDRPLKDSGLAALTVQLQSPVTGAASLKPRAAAASRPPPPPANWRWLCCCQSAGTLFISRSRSPCISPLRRGFSRVSPRTLFIVHSSTSVQFLSFNPKCTWPLFKMLLLSINVLGIKFNDSDFFSLLHYLED